MRRWLVLAASLALVLAASRAAGFETIAAVWRTVHPAGILASLVCWHLSLAVRIASWRTLLGRGAPPLGALAPPLALGFVLSNLAPAKTGEPAAALLVRRYLGLPLSRTLSALTAERAAHVVLLLATFAPAVLLEPGSSRALSPAARVAAAILAGIAIASLFADRFLRAAESFAARIPRVGPGAAAYVRALRDLAADPRRLFRLLALALAFWLLQYASLFAILRAGGENVNPVQAAVVAGVAILGGTITLLPLGTQDALSAVALGGYGVPLARGFALALFHSVLGLLAGAILAAVLGILLAARRPAANENENGSPSAP